MKTLFLMIVTALSAMAIAAPQKNITVKKAVLNLCVRDYSNPEAPVRSGCADRLQISKTKAVLFDLDKSASTEVENCLNRVIGNNRFHKISKSASFEVKGYITKVKGFFPNPSVEFEVFHIVDSKNICTLPLPR